MHAICVLIFTEYKQSLRIPCLAALAGTIAFSLSPTGLPNAENRRTSPYL
jgi:hypothetical protein